MKFFSSYFDLVRINFLLLKKFLFVNIVLFWGQFLCAGHGE